MQCPTCKITFQPGMGNHLIGTISKQKQVFVYYQMCPKCEEPIIGYRELREKEHYALSSDVEGLTLLTTKIINLQDTDEYHTTNIR